MGECQKKTAEFAGSERQKDRVKNRQNGDLWKIYKKWKMSKVFCFLLGGEPLETRSRREDNRCACTAKSPRKHVRKKRSHHQKKKECVNSICWWWETIKLMLFFSIDSMLHCNFFFSIVSVWACMYIFLRRSICECATFFRCPLLKSLGSALSMCATRTFHLSNWLKIKSENTLIELSAPLRWCRWRFYFIACHSVFILNLVFLSDAKYKKAKGRKSWRRKKMYRDVRLCFLSCLWRMNI